MKMDLKSARAMRKSGNDLLQIRGLCWFLPVILWAQSITLVVAFNGFVASWLEFIAHYKLLLARLVVSSGIRFVILLPFVFLFGAARVL
jgi:hypothetical protein